MTSVLSPTLSVPSTSTWRRPTPRRSKSGCNRTAPSPRLAESWAKAAGLASPYPRDRPSRKVSQGNLRRRRPRRGIRVPTAPRGSLSSLGLFSTDRRNKCDSWCRNLKGATRLPPTGNQVHREPIPIRRCQPGPTRRQAAAPSALRRASASSAPRARATPMRRFGLASGLPKSNSWVSGLTRASATPL